MLITKTNPTGIDNAIQKLQTDLHSKLLSKWGVETESYECYGRCYRNKKDNGYIAELFTGGIDYKDAYWNDNLKALSFFGVSDKVEADKGQAKANVSIIFFVDIAKLKPTITHRADEEIRQDVILSIGTNNNGFHYTGYETGLDNVLREYQGSYQGLKTVDMHPVHCFKINLSLIYKNNNC
jgi:hypothetical protein